MSNIKIIYDGECPLCSNYVQHMRLKSNYNLELIDARENAECSIRLMEEGFDLDKGMVIELEGQKYHGADGLHRLSLLSTRSNAFNRLNELIFRNPRRAKWLYPIMVFGRNLALKILGRSSIDTKLNQQKG